MAADDALLRCAQEVGVPRLIVRVYGWDRPCASIGYFQKIEIARQIVSSLDRSCFIVRRPTGGGFVDHATDWTYSMIYPENFFAPRRQDYHFVHSIIRKVLIENGGYRTLEEVTPERACRGKITRCFAEPSAFDLMSCGLKIAGAAQRRVKGWILHQGSVALSAEGSDNTLLEFAMAFVRSLGEQLENQISTRELETHEALRASNLFHHQYTSRRWNEKF